jgi:UDP-galactopyranose mutase
MLDLLCFSHLRWDFVFQRPQHLMIRFARERRVFYIEEPVIGSGPARLVVTHRGEGLYVAVPHVPTGVRAQDLPKLQQRLVSRLRRGYDIDDYMLWYYTPMALDASRHLTSPRAVVYDCMDELSAFRGAPPDLIVREAELLCSATLVFTGGHSLYEAKCRQHARVYPFPSSVDVEHFAAARHSLADPADQAPIPHPRLGFYGVIDERLDLDLLSALAITRPNWHMVMVGPVAKIDVGDLPASPNIHYLGMKGYAELPQYLSGWDVALLPFARNEATRYISPTKTPEYLAAGRPVVSTSIRDVVRPYGDQGLVRIADTPGDMELAVEAALSENAEERAARVDPFLSWMSWDRTWTRMHALVEEAAAIPASPRIRNAARAA